jgi:hypothetical protein
MRGDAERGIDTGYSDIMHARGVQTHRHDSPPARLDRGGGRSSSRPLAQTRLVRHWRLDARDATRDVNNHPGTHDTHMHTQPYAAGVTMA